MQVKLSFRNRRRVGLNRSPVYDVYADGVYIGRVRQVSEATWSATAIWSFYGPTVTDDDLKVRGQLRTDLLVANGSTRESAAQKGHRRVQDEAS